MNKVEKNLMKSFGRVRSDIVKLQEQVFKLAENQERLMEEIYTDNDEPCVTKSSKKKKKK
jgi:hypothetical protein